MSLSLSGIIKWNDKEWTQTTCTQKDGTTNITTGQDFDKKAVHFECSKHSSGELYPFKPDRDAAAMNALYLTLFVPHRALTAVGSTVMAAKDAATATVDSVKNFSSKKFSKTEAFKPVLNDLGRALRDGAIAYGAWTVRSLLFCAKELTSAEAAGIENGASEAAQSTLYSLNGLAQVVVITALASCFFYGAAHPQGFQRKVHQYVDPISVSPLEDGEAHRSSLSEKVLAILDGRYSLARLLNMHYMGKSSNDKFEEVKKD